ncbi:NepR family anti-sigma factor [Sphingobium ummariense]
MAQSRKKDRADLAIAAKGLDFVSWTTGQNVTGGDTNADESVRAPDMKAAGNASRRRRATTTKDEGHVAQALRNAYQRTVNEDIPSEMLDLLSKLD